jgi:hypothetical protein
MAIVGGSGTILGPFLGSGIILILRNWVSGFFHYYTAVLGIVFIVTVLWAPQGIMGTGGALARRRPRGGRMTPRSRSTGSRKCSAGCAPSTTPRSSWRAASGAC